MNQLITTNDQRRVSHAGRWAGALLTFGALAVARVVLPIVARRFINRALDESATMRGQIGRIRLSLLKGEISFDDLLLAERAHERWLVSCARVQIKLDRRMLVRRLLAGEVRLASPLVTVLLLPAPKSAERSPGEVEKGETMPALVERLPALRIDRLLIQNGRLRLTSFVEEREQALELDDVHLRLIGFATRRSLMNKPRAVLDAVARPFTTGELGLRATLAPFAWPLEGDLGLKLRNLDLTRLNPMLDALGNVDMKRGRLSAFCELVAQKGRIKGYVKPVIERAEIGAPDPDKSVGRAMWESFISGAARFFENEDSAQIATEVPIEGASGDPQIGTWQAFGGLLKNAFVRALKPDFNFDRSAKIHARP